MSDYPGRGLTEEDWAQLDAETLAFEAGIGRMILAFGDAERELYRVVLHYGGMTDSVGRSLLSGARASALAGFLRALCENTNVDRVRRDDLERCLSQLAAINTFRDRVVHSASGNSIGYADDKMTTRLVSNAQRVNRPSNAFKLAVGADTLKDAMWDLYGIENSLQAHRTTSNSFVPWTDEEDGTPPTWRFRPA
jgi:hypothetical protein